MEVSDLISEISTMKKMEIKDFCKVLKAIEKHIPIYVEHRYYKYTEIFNDFTEALVGERIESFNEREEKIQALEEQIENLEETTYSEADLEEVETERDAIQDAYDELETKHENLESEVDNLVYDIKNIILKHSENDSVKKDFTDLQSDHSLLYLKK